MKRLIAAVLCTASLLALTTSGSSKHAYKNANALVVHDTLPPTDTIQQGILPAHNDTFGGINKNMSDSNRSIKTDSLSLRANNRH